MSEQKITVPNIGDFKEVEVIEVLVKEGQTIKKDDSVITLESDKSSVEVPSNYQGKIKKINIKVGDKVSEGSIILLIETNENRLWWSSLRVSSAKMFDIFPHLFVVRLVTFVL